MQTLEMKNDRTGQITKVTIDPNATLTGVTTIEVRDLDENGEYRRVGWRTFPDAPTSMSDLDVMCQQVDGFKP